MLETDLDAVRRLQKSQTAPFSASMIIKVDIRVPLLLLLHSPPRSLGFTIFGEIFAYVPVFLYTTIEVVTFRLRANFQGTGLTRMGKMGSICGSHALGWRLNFRAVVCSIL